MKKFLNKIVLPIYFCQLLRIYSLSIPTDPLASISVVPHIWHPTLFLAFSVNATELQLYIDPQLKVYKPFDNDTAYLLLALSNTTVSNQPVFADVELFTVVMNNNKLYKSSLHLHFSNPLPVVAGTIYSPASYGYAYAYDMSPTLNTTFNIYQYIINDKEVQLNTSIRYNPNEEIDLNPTQISL